MTARVEGTLPRFSVASRVMHWTLAAPFLLLLATGLLLFVPRVKGVHVGGYRLVPLIHVLAGLVFTVALIGALFAQPGRRSLWGDLRRLFRAAPGDMAWLRYAAYALLGARLRQPPTGKFNAGQKLNALASSLFTAGLVVSGLVLAVNFFTKSVFSAGFVQSVYPYHDIFMLIAIPIVVGHIYFAVVNPGTRPALPGMFNGRVDRAWARCHHMLWVEEQERDGAPPVSQ
ncbi:MAG: formate dehydrogenase subunit gamma [Dehalococcoidia bacterium]